MPTWTGRGNPRSSRAFPDRTTRNRNLKPRARGRGCSSALAALRVLRIDRRTKNPINRFEPIHCCRDEGAGPGKTPTRFLADPSRSILSYNNSPDVGFNVSLNPYRGCEHGCIYCYARPTHEYLGFSAGLDFETRILVKENAPVLCVEN